MSYINRSARRYGRLPGDSCTPPPSRGTPDFNQQMSMVVGERDFEIGLAAAEQEMQALQYRLDKFFEMFHEWCDQYDRSNVTISSYSENPT